LSEAIGATFVPDSRSHEPQLLCLSATRDETLPD
jgi:hypothetical protein